MERLVTLTATLAPATLIGAQYVWAFGDSAGGSATTTLNQAQYRYRNPGVFTVTVSVTLVGSTQVVSGSATIVVQ